jgi:Tol biopolymer transport system component
MHLFLASLLAAAVPASQPLFLPDQVSGPENDYNWSEDDHGHAVFARSKADFAASRIWETQRTAAGWSAPRPVAFASADWRDSDPWLTPDGRWLYFISDRPAPGRAEDRRDLDLWRVRRVGKGWGTPEPLSALNTPAEELGPELHGDRLYFASTRKGGPGRLDFFGAPRKGNGFGPAVPLRAPLNSAQSEGDLTFSRDGKRAIFWREVGGRLVLHQSRRAGNGWSAPIALLAGVNIGPFNFTPAISRDGRSLIFASTAKRPGQAEGLADLYQVPLTR